MGFLNRVCLFFYSLFFAVLALGAAALTTGLFPLQYVWNEFVFLAGRWETGGVAFFLFLLSVHFLGVSVSRKSDIVRDSEVIVVKTPSGDIDIAVDAVANMLERLSFTVSGIRKTKVQVNLKKDAAKDICVAIKMELTIGQDREVSAISEALRSTVEHHLRDVIGISNFQLDIAVQDITNAPVAGRKRVH